MLSLRTTLPFLGIAVGQLFWLAQGAMLGCSYHPPVSVTEIPDDKPNFYTCQCDCSTTVSQTVRVRAVLDDAEQTLLGEDNDGATDLDMGIVPVGVRFDHVTIPAGALITAAAIQFTADAAFLTANNGPLNLDVFAVASPDAAPCGGGDAHSAISTARLARRSQRASTASTASPCTAASVSASNSSPTTLAVSSRRRSAVASAAMRRATSARTPSPHGSSSASATNSLQAPAPRAARSVAIITMNSALPSLVRCSCAASRWRTGAGTPAKRRAT